MWRSTEAGEGVGGHRPLPLAVALALLPLLATASCQAPSQDDGLHGTEVHEPVPAPELTLTDTEGRPFDLRDQAQGQVTLLFFGYTHCPDVCPVHMATLGAAFDELEPEVRDAVQVVFVSTDPDRDTPERIRSWLDGYHRSFVGLRGPIEDINAALGELMLPGVAVMPSEHGDEGEPLIGHPSAVVAFDRQGRARFRYPFGMRRADWLHDLPRLAEDL